ncbi:MAG: hypothetical protein R3B08_07915 [Nitrospira sp.]
MFSKEFPGNKFVVDSSMEVVRRSGLLQEDAMIAVLISFVGIVLYIAVGFELRFRVAAALATFHDVLAVLGVFYVLDKEITLLVVGVADVGGVLVDGYRRRVPTGSANLRAVAAGTSDHQCGY